MNNQKLKHKYQKGITLIALIITIVILLILAVVTIGAVQEDGIIGKAKYARDEYEKAQAKENSILQGYLDKLNENAGNANDGSGNTGNENTGNGTIEDGNTEDESTGNENTGDGNNDNVIIPPKTESKALLVDEFGNDAKNKVLSETVNTDVYDEYGNKIVVPAGFMIRVDESTTYADHATEGIVIQDASGNEFVWVPVGNIYYTETEYKTINLNRYTFEEDGTPIPQGDAVIESCYQELATSEYGNETAKDLQGFINSATTKGGYYLARYEAGVENGNLDTSDMVDNWTAPNSNWTGYVAEEGKEIELVSKKDVQVWNYVTQNKASELARGMYTSSNFTSDLVNSYAWDTAIVFIQTFSTEEDASNYANLNKSTSFANTGINSDKYCNIYDMSGNAIELITETCSVVDYPCVVQGGYYNTDFGYAIDYTSYRNSISTTYAFSSYCFRPLLYVAL